MSARLSAVWLSLRSLGLQCMLLLDVAGNVLLGVQSVLVAAATGEPQSACSSSETLSAHAWRAWQHRKLWALVLKPIIDVMFSWQEPVPDVNAAAGFVVTGHCERAYWKTRLRLNLDIEYRDPQPLQRNVP